MAWPAIAMAVGGLLGGAAGSWLKGNAADLARKKMEEAANLPGLDVNNISTQALNSLYGQVPLAAKSTNLINQTNLDQMNQMWGGVPGANQMLSQQSQNINDWLKGNLSKEVTDNVQRNAAVRALGGGYGGSGMMRNLMARDLGLNTLQLQQSAMPMAQQFAQQVKTTRFPELASIQQYTVNPNTWLGIRERERAAQQELMARMAGMPGKTAVWGDYFSNLGNQMGGMSGMMGGIGGGGGSGGLTGMYRSGSQYIGGGQWS